MIQLRDNQAFISHLIYHLDFGECFNVREWLALNHQEAFIFQPWEHSFRMVCISLLHKISCWQWDLLSQNSLHLHHFGKNAKNQKCFLRLLKIQTCSQYHSLGKVHQPYSFSFFDLKAMQVSWLVYFDYSRELWFHLQRYSSSQQSPCSEIQKTFVDLIFFMP